MASSLPSLLTLLLLLTTPITASPHPNPHLPPHQKRCAPPLSPQLRLGSNPQDTTNAQNPPYTVSLSSPTATDNATVNLGFVVPSDAVGPCSLMLALPSTTNVQGGPTQVNVVALDGPAPGAMVGTVSFGGGAAATINSFACREQMCYSLQVVAEGEGGGAQWVQFLEDGGGGGVYMTYVC